MTSMVRPYSFGGKAKIMKFIFALIVSSVFASHVYSQPELTLWITPDGYHDHSDHHIMQEYFCDSSYYIYYQQQPDTLFITTKNEGTDTLDLISVHALGFSGASFDVIGFAPIRLSPGGMVTLKVLYHLPSDYVEGLNGQLTIHSNDPKKPYCHLYFDVGCAVKWSFRVNDFGGVTGNCDTPIIFPDYSDDVVNANLMFEEVMAFYDYNPATTSSEKVMEIINDGVIIHKNAGVLGEFTAGYAQNTVDPSFSVDTHIVHIREALLVSATMRVSSLLQANSGINVDGTLFVNGNTNLDGNLDVLSNAKIDGTLEVLAMTTPSDVKLKTDILPLSKPLDVVRKLQPKSYFHKVNTDSNRRQYGFLAQDLEAVIPEIVHTNELGIKSVNYQQIIPWLTAAIKTQQELIEALEKRIMVLESR